MWQSLLSHSVLSQPLCPAAELCSAQSYKASREFSCRNCRDLYLVCLAQIRSTSVIPELHTKCSLSPIPLWLEYKVQLGELYAYVQPHLNSKLLSFMKSVMENVQNALHNIYQAPEFCQVITKFLCRDFSIKAFFFYLCYHKLQNKFSNTFKIRKFFVQKTGCIIFTETVSRKNNK